MRLERLEISGFKSFSDRAELAYSARADGAGVEIVILDERHHEIGDVGVHR